MQLKAHSQAQAVGRGTRSSRRVTRVLAVNDNAGDEQQQQHSLSDPEAMFRRYGPKFGSNYKIDGPFDWIKSAPRIRHRTSEDRKLEELLEVAVLNARLSGEMPAHEARQRLEYLKLRRKNWEAIYHFISETDAVATLELIEEANRRVEEALSDDLTQQTSVYGLQQKLMDLQKEVDTAANKLANTQSRVDLNLKRINELKAEAARLERLRNMSTVAETRPARIAAAKAAMTTVANPVANPAASLAQNEASLAAPMPNVMRPPKQRPGRGLQSSLDMEDPLRNFWFPAAFSSKLTEGRMMAFELFGEPWVMFRDERGQPACIRDSCAHRSCPLSIGKVVEGRVQCPYHGWEFDGDGMCTKMPSTTFCRNVAVTALPVAEKDGFVWVWPGDAMPGEVPDYLKPKEGFIVHAEIEVEVPCEHGLLVENLLDLAHAPFTHQGTFARGWTVPDSVRFNATKMLSGHWDPYPIDMAFHPPCVTESLIGLARPGVPAQGSSALACKTHLHQNHICTPARRGHTRLLYRMCMDFMQYLKYVPYIDRVWQNVANQVLGEDLVLVVGQQDRMQKGDDTWANPMPYDKIAVRYRRWRNSVASGDLEAGARYAAIAKASAGEMFADDGDVAGDEQVGGTSRVAFGDAAPQVLLSDEEEARILNEQARL